MSKHQYSPEQAFLRAGQCQKKGKYLEVKVYALMISVKDNPLNVPDVSKLHINKFKELLQSQQSNNVKVRNHQTMPEPMRQFIRSFCSSWLNQGPNSIKQQMKIRCTEHANIRAEKFHDEYTKVCCIPLNLI